jgi:EndoU nuclease-like protein
MTSEERRQFLAERAGESESQSPESGGEPSRESIKGDDAGAQDEPGIDDERGSDDDERSREPDEQEPGESDSAKSGWETPECAEHPQRPERSDIHLTDDRRTHILDGEGDNRGGHRHGTGVPAKTEFPADWDDPTAVGHILDVARHPDQADFQKNGRWLVTGERDGVEVDVVIRPDGRIITAYPLPGGRGVNHNPKEGQ